MKNSNNQNLIKELLLIKKMINFDTFRTIKIVSNMNETDLAIIGFYKTSRILLKADFNNFQTSLTRQTTMTTDLSQLPEEYHQIYCFEHNIKESDIIASFKEQYDLLKEIVLNSEEVLAYLIKNPKTLIQFKQTDNNYAYNRGKKDFCF